MSIGSFFNWVVSIFKKPKGLNALVVYEEKQTRNFLKPDNTKLNKYYLADKVNPQLVIQRPVPTSTVLPLYVVGDKGGGYPLGTIQQQAMGVKQMVNTTLFYMQKKSPRKFTSWAAQKMLTIQPRAGKDLNAYYDRSSLKFFYFGDPVRKENVYTCDSHTVVTHELGHAVLDILRPDWWNTTNLEHWSLHEAFGDITALFAMLQYDQLIETAIAQTQGNLEQSNILSRLAPELGLALYNITKGKNGELPFAMRDLSTKFEYANPNQLPKSGREDRIVAECHSFGRIFSNAIYDIFVKTAKDIEVNNKKTLFEACKDARDIVADILLKAVVSCPNNPKLFEAMAKQMLSVDNAQGKKIQKIMNEVFTKRKIISTQLKMLADEDFENFINKNKKPMEIQVTGNSKIVILQTKEKIKITDVIGLSALSANPLYNLEVTVPNQITYVFDQNDKLIEMYDIDKNELITSTMNALNYLDENNLVGPHNSALFEIQGDQLIRKQFVCKCNKPNYCDPNAPEYGKPWKPANNSGCAPCYNKNCLPESCDCVAPPKEPAPKLGCYVGIKSGNRSTYKICNKASRRVC